MSPEDFEQNWRRRFERFGRTHQDDAQISGWSPAGLEARFRHFRRSWKPEGRRKWLDAGCGPGTYTRYLLENGQDVVGIDYSLPSIQKARDRSPSAMPWIVSDVQHLPLPRNSFDGALCFGVFQALARPDAAVRELAGIVRPGGSLWIDALNDWCLFSRLRRLLDRNPKHPLRYDSPRQLRRLFEENGFTGVRIDWVPIVPGGRPWLQRWFDSRLMASFLRWFPPAAWAICHAVVIRGARR